MEAKKENTGKNQGNEKKEIQKQEKNIEKEMSKLNIEEEKQKKEGGESWSSVPPDEPNDEPDESEEKVDILNIEGITNEIDKTFLFSSNYNNWNIIKVPEKIIKALADCDYMRPSKIQAFTIPLINSEPPKHLIAQSQNGSGKTLAFVVGSLMKVDESSNAVQIVALSHTRELAKQTYEVFKKITKYMKVEVILAVVNEEVASNQLGQIIVGTPGTIEFLVTKRQNKFNQVKILIFDEADYLLTEVTGNMYKTVYKLYKEINMKKQCLLYSATFPDVMRGLISKMMTNANLLKLDKGESMKTLQGLAQFYIDCHFNVKEKLLAELLKLELPGQKIIFVNTKQKAFELQDFLTKSEIPLVGLLTGALTPPQRDEILKKYIDVQLTTLITTNVLARGFDDRNISLSVNFDLPIKKIKGVITFDPISYIHRIGRTGRFGDFGVALNFACTKYEREGLQQFEKESKSKINHLSKIEEIKDNVKSAYLKNKEYNEKVKEVKQVK